MQNALSLNDLRTRLCILKTWGIWTHNRLLHYGRGTWKIAVLGSELPVGKLVEIMLDVLHLPFPARFSLREENTHSLQAWHSLLPVEPNLSFDYSFNDYSIAFLDETLPIYFLPRRSGLIGNWLDGLSGPSGGNLYNLYGHPHHSNI